MFKWLFRIVLFVVFVIVVGLFAVKIYLEKYFDKDIIVKAVEAETNSRFELTDVSIGIFSFTPSLEIKGIKLGKRDKYADDKVHIDERPAMEGETVSVENIELKANLIPLFDKRFELNKFIIQRPVARLTLGEEGQNNLSPLLGQPSGKAAAEEPAETVEKEAEAPEAEAPAEPQAPQEEFSAKDVPIAATMNQIGIENGEVDIFFKTTQQRFLISDFFMVIDKIDIDPKDLANHNKATVTFNTNIAIFNKEKSEQAKLSLRSNADVRPLDPRTGKVEPEAVYSVSLGKGSFIQALVALEKVKSSLATLEKVGINLDILSKKAVLSKDAETAIRYKEGKVSFEEDLKVLTADYDVVIQKASWFNVMNNQHSFKGNLTVSEAESKKLLDQVDKFIDDSMNDIKIKGVKIDKQEIKDELLSGVVRDGRIFIEFESKGDISDPDVKVSFMPVSLTDLIKKKAGALVDQKIEEVKEKVNEEIDKAKAEAQSKIDEEKAAAEAKAAEEKAKAEAEAKKKADKAAEEAKKKIKIPGF
ncbi:MAG: AsmA family protein [Candidatus Delongbacteria bacterium]|nr:AsmA family protein [Candidatus Delongbacteria bacterium]